jgi:acetylornithine deacetylase
MTNPLDYAVQLVEVPSVSLQSNSAVSDVVATILNSLQFEVERQEFLDPHGVPKVNLIGKRGTGTGGVAYFGHTDVVPATTWSCREHGPFDPTVKNGRLYGRGSCDMKGSIACAMAAAGRIDRKSLAEPLYIVCTADEEVGFHGARHLVEHSTLYREIVAGQSRAIVGEPTELSVVHAHKGIFGFRAIAQGNAAHSSTRDGINANLLMIPFLNEMKQIYDETLTDPHWLNDQFDPPWISWNLGINDLNCAVNITAPKSLCTVYFRPMPGQDGYELVERARTAAQRFGLEFHLECSGQPLFSDPRSDYVQETLKVAGESRSKTVSYGTDGVMFTELNQIVVLGPGSIQQAHTDDEWIALDQLSQGTALFEQIFRRWCVL